LHRRAQAEQRHAIDDCGDDDAAEHGVQRVAATAEQAGAADACRQPGQRELAYRRRRWLCGNTGLGCFLQKTVDL
jgi:hypothetical protein